ncbi:twin-arginine translocase TatA/TatE family subunit [Chloroflexota bacterium]
MPFRVGPWEIGLVLLIILIVFGVGKLPQVGGAVGKGLREFRKGQRGESDSEDDETKKVASQKEPESQTKK